MVEKLSSPDRTTLRDLLAEMELVVSDSHNPDDHVQMTVSDLAELVRYVRELEAFKAGVEQ